MWKGQQSSVLREIHALFSGGTQAGLTDGELLTRFIACEGDVAESAFAALVERHGPMVFRICRRVLVDPHRTEDAFQATFLILVRKAGTLRDRGSVGNWLYGVACRVAAKARAVSSRRRGLERPFAEGLKVFSADGDPDRGDLDALLHEELGLLPERYRIPIVLCYLEGITQEEAANRLGWPLGTVRSRLARARERLRGRLTRRGVILSASGLGTALAGDASASAPQALIDSTVKAALRFAAMRVTAAGVVPASVDVLMQGVLRTMLMTKLKIAAGALVALGIAAVSTGVFAYQDSPDGQKTPPNTNSSRASSDGQTSSDDVKSLSFAEPPVAATSASAPAKPDAARRSRTGRQDVAVYLERTKREVDSTIEDLEAEVTDLRTRLEQAEANLQRMKALQAALSGPEARGAMMQSNMADMMGMMRGGSGMLRNGQMGKMGGMRMQSGQMQPMSQNGPMGSMMENMMRGMGSTPARQQQQQGVNRRSSNRSQQSSNDSATDQRPAEATKGATKERREALDREIRRLTEERDRLEGAIHEN